MAEPTMLFNDPVTVVVRHKVRPGYEKHYEEWASGISEVVRKYDGYLGVNFIRPATTADNEYAIIFKFNSYSNLRQWEQSDERREWAEKRKSFTIEEPDIQHFKGWDYWFTLPGSAKITPSKFKMACITLLSIYFPALFIPRILQPVTGTLPEFVAVMINAAVIVPLMAYLIMPLMIRLFSFWLYPKTKHT